MKKILFSAVAFAVVAVSAVAVAPTTSEAIPAFARQTGAACLACHFQSFPTLNAFGRSFKQGAFTDMGEQALIEDDDLSLPVVVNFSLVLRPQFASVKVSGDPVPANNTTTKTAAVTADQVILFGARIGEHSGAFIEYDGTFANYQQINSWDFDGFKAGVSVFNTGFGETAGMEVGSTFGQHGGLMAGKGLSASEQISKGTTGGGTGGVALFAANELVTASVSLISTSAVLDGAVPNGWKLAPSARVFVNPEVGGFELGIGAGITSGTTGNAATVAALAAALNPGTTSLEMKKWMFDAQAQGEVGGMELGVYADYSSASASTATKENLFNPLLVDVTGYSVRANIKPLHNWIFQAGYGSLGATNAKRKQWQVAAEYEFYQNFVIALIYNNSKVNAVTTTTTTLDIEALM